MNPEIVKLENKILAIVARTDKINDRLNYLSPEEFPMQVGVHTRDKNTSINPHYHLPFENLSELPSQEIIYVEHGKIKIGIYNETKKITDKILGPGDLIILNSGHDLKFLEDSKFLLIKQGPYRENSKKYLDKNDTGM